jgi:hypothetical protein
MHTWHCGKLVGKFLLVVDGDGALVLVNGVDEAKVCYSRGYFAIIGSGAAAKQTWRNARPSRKTMRENRLQTARVRRRDS